MNKPIIDKPINIISTANEQKIKEPYILSTYNPIEEISSHKVQLYHEAIMEESKELFTISQIKHPADKRSIYDFLYDDCAIELLSRYMDEIKKSMTPEIYTSTKKSIASLYLRCKRTRLKIYIVYKLLKNTNSREFVLNQRFHLIFENIKKKIVHIDFKNLPEKGPSITLSTTIALIVKQLQEVEVLLKQLLPGLVESYKLPLIHPGAVPAIINALTEIAPVGFKGKETDYYYLIRLILSGSPMFNKTQQAQWNTYLNEFYGVLQFCVNVKTIDFSALVSNDRTINVPIEEFLASDKCSNNTFSRLINAFNKIMSIVWMISCGSVLLNEPKTENSSTAS